MPAAAPHAASHRWRFFRCGGFDQVALERADDLRHLHQLDPKLWTALSCPTTGLEFDARTLALLDTNGDGHIGVQEVLAAVQWACARLTDPQAMFAGGPLALASIATADEEGQRLRAAAGRVAALLGKPEAAALAPEDFADMTKLFQPGEPNGDGVVPAALAEPVGLKPLVEAIVATQGGTADRSGEGGATAASTAAFFEQAQAVLAWRRRAGAEGVQPLGEATAAAAAALDAVRAKVEDFFTRCRLAAYDARAAEPLNPAPDRYGALAGALVAPEHDSLQALPLATVAAGAALPLHDGVNPAWAARLAALHDAAVAPLLGARAALTAEDWAALCARLAPYAGWLAERPAAAAGGAAAVADLDDATLATLTAGDARARLEALIAQDAAADASADTVDALCRLTHLHRDLVTLLRNFVSLADFYDPARLAIFQAGTLYLDQRSCELVLRVADMDAHARMAPFSLCYLVYCQCERAGSAPMTVAAALTGGAVDELMVPGRHGVLVDRQGQEWKATVLKVVEQPVSVRQAFFAPYRRLAAFVENQMRNFAAAKDKEVEAKSQTAAATAPAAAPAAAQGFDIARFAGIFAAIGLALGALGTAVTAAVSGLFQLAAWQIPIVLAAVLLVISGPSMLLAWFKLRRRNLGPLLDANGWAVNARARINIPFGGSLTALAALPPGSSQSLSDPFAEKGSPWPALLGVAAVAALAFYAWRALGAGS
jgi:hypothetical protein